MDLQGPRKQIPKNYRKKSGWIFSDCLPLCAISPSTAIVSRELLISIGLFDQTLPACEDYDLWLRIASRYPVLLVDEALIEKHGGHDDQLSNQRGLDLFRILALEKFLDSPNSKAEYIEMAKRTLLENAILSSPGPIKAGARKWPIKQLPFGIVFSNSSVQSNRVSRISLYQASMGPPL